MVNNMEHNIRVAILYQGIQVISIHYIHASVLLENNQCHIFHILTSEDINDIIYCFLH